MFNQVGIVYQTNHLKKGDIAMSEETKKIELVGIELKIFEDWLGARIVRDVKIGDGSHKFTTGLPVPQNNHESQDLYQVSLS